MTDIVSAERRSMMMAGIKSKNTKPELIIRSALHNRGFRYRTHVSNLPGKPDIVLPKYKAVIFIQGCFWHGHKCNLFKWPHSRSDFWRKKIINNINNDERHLIELATAKWRILYIWECALKGKNKLFYDDLVENVCRWLLSSTEFLEIKGKS